MICSEASLVNSDGPRGAAVTLRCKCWHCEICQPFNRWAVIRRGKAGEPNTFITLTVNPTYLDSPQDRARALVAAWRTVRRRALKRYGFKSIPFLAVFEATKNGEPHLHILARTGWIDQRWLSEQMRDLLLAPIVDIRRIQDQGRTAAYVAKYVGKSPHRFERTKRFWTSLDWLSEDFTPEAQPQLFGEHWIKVRMTLDAVEVELQKSGYLYARYPHKILWGEEDPP